LISISALRVLLLFSQLIFLKNPPATHISDLATLYALLVEKIIQKEPIPSGEGGYYFAMAHRGSWWDIMQRIAESLHARGLVARPSAVPWPSYDLAAQRLGFPAPYVRAMATSRCVHVPYVS
jgi:dTDP-4-dehydrorhamnose reductase